MSAGISGHMSLPQPENRLLFSARLRPHRSLSSRNFRLVMMLLTGLGLFASLPFVLSGAWPVAGFMGMAIAILYLGFRANFRAARAYEDLQVTFFELILTKVSPGGERVEWRFNPSFVRLEQERHEEFGLLRLALVSRGRAVELAAFLGPAAKADLAANLSRALSEARRGPRYS